MGTATINLPVNPHQIAQAVNGSFTTRTDEAAGTVEIEAPDLSDSVLSSALAGITYDATAAPVEEINERTLREQSQASLTVLRTSVDTLKTVTDKTNANIGPADTKTVARETRRVARQMLALTRLLIGALDTVDTGTD